MRIVESSFSVVAVAIVIVKEKVNVGVVVMHDHDHVVIMVEDGSIVITERRHLKNIVKEIERHLEVVIGVDWD